ncbi:type IV secretion system protein [Kushneria indalinina]|uniref:Type IV secretion system VirB5/TraC/TraE/TrbJ family protein n=1 Tax=Kushneria indalinina DSM 14324 TaxID=1122140 RepID=A0A3D9DSE6_9GAMM|nr:type IV secretion system protein [Kushneria indalinina]REC93324.1 type IV secretion system VirB5/TraC/TraE/TrbJ family protein [Kushneria indalinina DSM 14324]
MTNRTQTRSLLLALCLLSADAHAQVPTTDVANLAQAVKAVEEAQRQYDQVKNNFDTQMRAIKGNNWGRVIRNVRNNVDYIPVDNWRDIDSIDVAALRQRYDLVSDDPQQQQVYDKEMRYLAANEAAYRSQQQRLANIEEYKRRAADAQTPQQREELQNAISLEVAAMQSDQNRLDNLNRNMDREAKLRERSANRELASMFEAD